MDNRRAADGLEDPEGNNDPLRRPGGRHSAGVNGRGMHTNGSPRNLGGPTVSTNKEGTRRGAGITKPWPSGGRAVASRKYRTASGAEVVPVREATSVPGWTKGVGVHHSTDEVGEPGPRGPGGGKGVPGQGLVEGKDEEMPSSEIVSTKLQRIAKLAKEAPDMAFTSLSHHIDLDWLEEAYRRTRKDGAPGIDGQTAREYAENLEQNLQSLLDRAKSGRYRAPAVKRGYVPKGDGSEQRPIGIPTFEDKVLQRAVCG